VTHKQPPDWIGEYYLVLGHLGSPDGP